MLTCWHWLRVSCGHMELMRAENGPPNTGTCCVGVAGAADGLYSPGNEKKEIDIDYKLKNLNYSYQGLND